MDAPPGLPSLLGHLNRPSLFLVWCHGGRGCEGGDPGKKTANSFKYYFFFEEEMS